MIENAIAAEFHAGFGNCGLRIDLSSNDFGVSYHAQRWADPDVASGLSPERPVGVGAVPATASSLDLRNSNSPCVKRE